MKRLLLLTMITISCQNSDINFKYQEMRSMSGIVIEDYRPVTRHELTRFLIKVNDTLRMDCVNVFINGRDIYQINPSFKKDYYSEYSGKRDLTATYNNDTTRAMKNLHLHFGTLKRDSFIKMNDYDKKFLNNKFLRSADK